MVAMTLGLIISASVLAAYVTANRSAVEDEQYARMQENGRYALRVISEELGMVEFWGKVTSVDDIDIDVSAPAAGCADAADIFDLSMPLLFNNNHDASAPAQFTLCAAVAAKTKASTDTFLIKRMLGAPVANVFVDTADTDSDGDDTEIISEGLSNLVDGSVYLRSNTTSGQLINDASATNPPSVGHQDWLYVPRLYFVRDYYRDAADGIPALCRLSLDALELSPVSTTEFGTCIAEGVEDLHLEFGIDNDNDGTPDTYTSAPTATQVENAVVVRAHLLLRSTDEIANYVNGKSYSLGSVSLGPFNDGFYRAVFTTTVILRNSIARIMMQ